MKRCREKKAVLQSLRNSMDNLSARKLSQQSVQNMKCTIALTPWPSAEIEPGPSCALATFAQTLKRDRIDFIWNLPVRVQLTFIRRLLVKVQLAYLVARTQHNKRISLENDNWRHGFVS